MMTDDEQIEAWLKYLEENPRTDQPDASTPREFMMVQISKDLKSSRKSSIYDKPRLINGHVHSELEWEKGDFDLSYAVYGPDSFHINNECGSALWYETDKVVCELGLFSSEESAKAFCHSLIWLFERASQLSQPYPE